MFLYGFVQSLNIWSCSPEVIMQFMENIKGILFACHVLFNTGQMDIYLFLS